jgi:hypothetical protein
LGEIDHTLTGDGRVLEGGTKGYLHALPLPTGCVLRGDRPVAVLVRQPPDQLELAHSIGLGRKREGYDKIDCDAKSSRPNRCRRGDIIASQEH